MANLSSLEIESELKRILKIPSDDLAPQQRRMDHADSSAVVPLVQQPAVGHGGALFNAGQPLDTRAPTNAKRVRNRKNKVSADAAGSPGNVSSGDAEPRKPTHTVGSSSQNRAPSDVHQQQGGDSAAAAAAAAATTTRIDANNRQQQDNEEADEALLGVQVASREMRSFNLSKLTNIPNLKDLPPDLLRIIKSQGIIPVEKKSPKHPNARFNCTLCKYHCDTLNVCETHIRGERHLALLVERNMDVSLRQLPAPNENQADAIDRLLRTLTLKNRILDADFERAWEIVVKLDKLITDGLPAGCRVRMFGSMFTQLGVRGTPVNVDLEVPLDTPLNPAFMLKKCSELLSSESGGCSNVVCDFEDKMPSVSFVHRETGLAFVLSLNKTASWQTSKLLREYGLMDERCRKLATAFRLWGRICKVDNQLEGTLPPHSFDLMLVYFLQQLTPPVLPVLHDFAPSEGDFASAKAVAKLGWKTKNTMTAGYLWVELFRYYAVIFPKVGCAICITDAKPVPLAAKKWQGVILGIEDPYMKKRNLTRCISSKRMGDFVMSCFKYSFRYFGTPQTKGGPLFKNIRRPAPIESKMTSSLGDAMLAVASETQAGAPRSNSKFGGYLTDDEKINHLGLTAEESSKMTLLESQSLKTLPVKKTDEPGGDKAPTRREPGENADERRNCEPIAHFGNAVSDKADNVSERSNSDNSGSDGDEDDECGDNGPPGNDDVTAVHQPTKAGGGDGASRKQQQQTGKGETKSKKTRKEKRAQLFELLATPMYILKLIDTMGASDYVYDFAWAILTNKKVPLIECTICQKEGHLKTDCPDEKLPPLIRLPPPNKAFLQLISCLCCKVAEIVQTTRVEVEERNQILHDLREFIRNFYPDAELKLFGSSCNGFGFRRSDLDICLTFASNDTGKGLNYADIIVQLADKLKNFKSVAQVIPIPTAKVPIVKFVHKWSRLDCDLSLYNNLAHHNTQMLLLYTKIDERVSVLGCMVKHFAKLCSIGDASRGSLSSYAYILMMLHFLQQRRPPIIPVLQEVYYEGQTPPTVMVDGWNAWFFNSLPDLKKVWPHQWKNEETVGQLWLGFLRYYTEEFNVKENVINIRQLKPLSRFEKLWNSKCLAIEDPFDLSHNLGSGISRKMNAHILKAFIKGRELFGTPIFNVPFGHNSIEEYLLNNELLTGGPPPTDGCCRFCGKIGHWARHCPRKQNMKDSDDRRRAERRRGPKNGLAAQQQHLDRQQMDNRFQHSRPQGRNDDLWANQRGSQQQQASGNWRSRAPDQHSPISNKQNPKGKQIPQPPQPQQRRAGNNAGHHQTMGTTNHPAASSPGHYQYSQGLQLASGGDGGNPNKMAPNVTPKSTNFQLFGSGSRPTQPLAFNPETTSSPLPHKFPMTSLANGELPPRRLENARPLQQQQPPPWPHGMGPPPGFGSHQPSPRPYFSGPPPMQPIHHANLYGFSGPPSRTIPPFAAPRPEFNAAPGGHVYLGGGDSGRPDQRMDGHVPKSA